MLDAILRNDLESFLRRCLVTLNPGMPFLPNWHIKAIAYQLERVRRGEVNRLIINMPPRHLKSLTVSVAFPAFLLGLEPWHRIFAISYGSELSLKHARDFRAIVDGALVLPRLPQMRIARDTEDGVYTSLKGFRQATSIGGSLTGMGGDLFIIDDPLKPLDAQSEPARTRVNQWIFNTLMSRLDNKQNGRDHRCHAAGSHGRSIRFSREQLVGMGGSELAGNRRDRRADSDWRQRLLSPPGG